MEQLVARRAHNPEVAGSNPAPAIKSEEDDFPSAAIGSARPTLGKPKKVTTASPVSRLVHLLIRTRKFRIEHLLPCEVTREDGVTSSVIPGADRPSPRRFVTRVGFSMSGLVVAQAASRK